MNNRLATAVFLGFVASLSKNNIVVGEEVSNKVLEDAQRLTETLLTGGSIGPEGEEDKVTLSDDNEVAAYFDDLLVKTENNPQLVETK